MKKVMLIVALLGLFTLGAFADYVPPTPPVTIYPAYDINQDGVVNLFDVVLLCGVYGMKWDNPNWNPAYDINNDGIINLFDVVTILGHYGEKCVPIGK